MIPRLGNCSEQVRPNPISIPSFIPDRVRRAAVIMDGRPCVHGIGNLKRQMVVL